jgi:hypothetical protein
MPNCRLDTNFYINTSPNNIPSFDTYKMNPFVREIFGATMYNNNK